MGLWGDGAMWQKLRFSGFTEDNELGLLTLAVPSAWRPTHLAGSQGQAVSRAVLQVQCSSWCLIPFNRLYATYLKVLNNTWNGILF